MLLWLTVGLWTAETDAHQLITMGFVAPYSGRAGYTLTAPGATVAIERAKSEGLLNDIDIRYATNSLRPRSNRKQPTYEEYSIIALCLKNITTLSCYNF